MKIVLKRFYLYCFAVPALLLAVYCVKEAETRQSTDLNEKYKETAELIVRTALEDNKGYKLLKELCDIGYRLCGSEGSKKSIKWAEGVMKDMGFDKVWLQPVKVPHWERGDIEKAKIIKSGKYKNRDLSVCALGKGIGTSKQGITGEILEVQSFTELREKSDLAKGRIIFFNRPFDTGTTNTFGSYGGAVGQRGGGAIEAAKVGGIAAIIRSVTSKYDNVPHTGSLRYEEGIKKLPSVCIGQVDADFLSGAVKDDPKLQVNIKLSCKNLPEEQSYNVIAEIKGSEFPNEVIVVGGHFDAWDKGDGAHDDGAGCIQSLEVLDLFKRLNIKPERTVRCVFFMNEEMGLNGGIEYGKFAAESGEVHVAAIESDRGALTPRGFGIGTNDPKVVEKIQTWLPYLQTAKIEWVRQGGGGADISRIRNAKALIGFVPDVQRYFDFHHSANDVYEEIHPREMELGSAAMAILTYLLSEEGL